MTDRIMAVLALAVLTAFLGVLVWKVPRIDLAAIIAITLLLAYWDFFSATRRNARSR